jgi:hypothetical protein
MSKPRTNTNGYIVQWEEDGEYLPWTDDMATVYFTLYPEKSKLTGSKNNIPTKDEQIEVAHRFNKAYSHKWGGNIKPENVLQYVSNFLGGRLKKGMRIVNDPRLQVHVNNFRRDAFGFKPIKKWGR